MSQEEPDKVGHLEHPADPVATMTQSRRDDDKGVMDHSQDCFDPKGDLLHLDGINWVSPLLVNMRQSVNVLHDIVYSARKSQEKRELGVEWLGHTQRPHKDSLWWLSLSPLLVSWVKGGLLNGSLCSHHSEIQARQIL